MANGEDHLSNYLVDRMIADSIDQTERERAGAHLEVCQACAHKLQRARDDARQFLLSHPPPQTAALLLEQVSVDSRARRGSSTGARWSRPCPARRWLESWRWRLLVPALATASVAGMVLALLARTPAPSGTHGLAAVVAKGSPGISLLVRRQGQGGLWEGRSGESFAAGDVLQLEVSQAGGSTVSVYSMDHYGKLSALFSFAADETTTRAPASLTLDDSIESERLWVFFASMPLADEVIRAAATEAFEAAARDVERVEAIRLPGSDQTTKVRSILLRKQRALPGPATPNVSPDE
ncbi:MAG: hypothetical protein V2A73_09380 [Pseudomonadota bacterium]